MSNRPDRCESIADGLLAGQGIVSSRRTRRHIKRLCRELLKAKMKVLKAEMQRMDGEYERNNLLQTQCTLERSGMRSGPPYAAPSPAPITKLFSIVSEAYLSEFSNRQPRTQGDDPRPASPSSLKPLAETGPSGTSRRLIAARTRKA